MQFKTIPIALALACGLMAAAHADPSVSRITSNIERIVGHKVGPVKVTPTPAKRIYEVQVDGATFYADETGRYLIVGSGNPQFFDAESPKLIEHLKYLESTKKK